jgi:glycosyltransferase involved in cell wall biosynthesis
MQCSLIIATYNWPEALFLCLESVMQQVVLPNEIVVADDGSTDETKMVIEKFQQRSAVPIVHVWHPDEGFKLAQIRNKAFATAKCAYLIQIDGDLVLHKHFIADHLFLAKAHCFVSGSRVLLSEATTKALINNKSIEINTHTLGNNKNFFNGFRNRLVSRFLASRYKQKGSNKYYVKGCNMAFWKKDLQLVNGYNENFTGWGREDSELAIRLINAGIKKRFLKMGGVSFHLYHKEASREMEEKNVQLMKDAVTNKATWAPNGLNNYQ